MVHESQKTRDARFDAARLRTVIGLGLILLVCGTVALFLEIDMQDFLLGIGALTAAIVVAAGVGPHASLIGTRSLPRVSLVVVGASFLLLTPVVFLLSGIVMTISMATGASSAVASQVVLLGGAAIAAAPVLLCAVFAGMDLAVGGRVPAPWGWLVLPALVLSVVAIAIKAGIAAASLMAWMAPWTDLYRTLTALQAIGAIVLGSVSLIFAAWASSVSAADGDLRAG